jgi:hypothetical protein
MRKETPVSLPLYLFLRLKLLGAMQFKMQGRLYAAHLIFQ